MKRFWLMTASIIVFATLCGCTANSTEKKAYTMGVRFGIATEMDAQNKSIYSDLVKILSNGLGVKFDYKWFTSDEAFTKAIGKGELDLFYTPDMAIIIKYLNGPAYSPFITPFFLGKKGTSCCIYVSKESKFKKISDLKEAKIIVPNDMITYYLLRDFLNEKPENIFASFASSPNAMSSAYSLAMNVTDAAIFPDSVISFLKINNPGPTKKISPIACLPELGFSPIMIKNNIPEEIKSSVKTFLMNAVKSEDFKKYRPLFKAYKMGFYTANIEDYGNFITLLEKAHKNGWDKDYPNWAKTVKMESK
jgi:ABC-type phosphate/phosphonate transport system substrate-binding protein